MFLNVDKRNIRNGIWLVPQPNVVGLYNTAKYAHNMSMKKGHEQKT